MKALSIKQPWATLIRDGVTLPDGSTWHKTVEGRSWPTSFRGPLVIHASKTPDKAACRMFGLCGPLGVTVAQVDLVDCVRGTRALDQRCIPPRSTDPCYELFDNYDDDSEWWAWVFADVRPLAPRRDRGRLGLWDIADDLVVPA